MTTQASPEQASWSAGLAEGPATVTAIARRAAGTGTARRGQRLRRRLAADADVRALPAGPPPEDAVTAGELAGLPEAAQRFLGFAGVVGRSADWSFLAHFRGRFRLRPGQRWMPCEAWQYSSRPAVARVFHLRVDFAGAVPMLGRDSYLAGRGRMRGRLLGLIPVADGSGPEFDTGELVTFLNDAVLWAPSMLLRLPVSWQSAGDRAFDVSLTDAGHQVTARVFLDERGAPCDFSTADRFCDTPAGLVRARWTTPVTGWTRAAGRWLPARGTATWDLPAGAFSYVEFEFRPGDITYNVPPPGA